MADFDFAIHGTGLFSALLAGILARTHGKRVVRIGLRPSAQRLPRQLDLALPLSARPENWQLVRAAEAETRRSLADIAPEGVEEIEAGLIADNTASAMALDHLGHLAHGFGHQVRRTGNGWALRRVSLIQPELIVGKLGEWLALGNVVAQDEGPADATRIVLADDAAILDFFPEDKRPASLRSEAMTASLLVAPRPLTTPLQLFPDRGVTLLQRPGNAVLALVVGEHDIDARLASTLAGPFPIKRLATTRYRRIVSADGAPLIGMVGDAFVIAGLGPIAAFLAPAVARLLAGSSAPDESAWFAARDPASANRASLADIGAAS